MNSTTRPRARTRRLLALALAAGLAISACGSDDDNSSGTPDGTSGGGDTGDTSDTGDTGDGEVVTISVSNLPPETEAATRKAFLDRVDEFEAANPNIDIEPNEFEWDVATFAAQMQGGTLPTVFEMPFPDTKGLVERGQIADITEQFNALPYADDLNPNVLSVAQDADGNVYGIPFTAYGIGLHYNRALFEEAGLDPDAPPTSWAEIRDAAKAISDATGQAGYAQMSQNNTGGWMLTSLSYTQGGRMQDGSGDDVTSTLNNPGTVAALELLQQMRWQDNSMGSNFLYEWGTINQDFAAGRIGMYMSGSDVYNSLVTENEINPDDYGLAVLPLEGDDAGVLSGGSVAVLRADATDAEKEAGVKWIDFFYMQKLTDEAQAVADAEALAANDAPIGTPVLPIFDEAQLAQQQAWIAEFVNVPLDQMASFADNILSQPIVPEPPAHTQEMYAILDTVVQAVLTEENADIGALLDQADISVTALIEAD